MAYRRFKRWLYRGNRPGLLARWRDRAWATLHARGIAPDHLVTLEVRGRRTAPGARPHIPLDRNDPVEGFEAIAWRIPVFRVLPAG